ncbi:acyl-CoA thioesterase [Comamonas sp. Y33R10-2]|uniref:acyl-CoA thioesterase n=1 Tax=Comamonas sp. Y33R10-2 TaxID=2853257 RepID=UPI001C5C8DF5|nr:thioesterase family protein [Comamonas sp. Y33R10-2]QXZ08366.1 acyl-CoA thioesterase [Comamonas sp. Y33R10-2]
MQATTLKLSDIDLPAPFVHKRTVRFGDTDAAQIVYTVNFFHYAMDALDDWFRTVLEHDWFSLNVHYGVCFPLVQAGLDFKAPLRPSEEISIEIVVTAMGRSSLQFCITGTRPDGIESFQGLWKGVFINPHTMKSASIPEVFIPRIQSYMDACSHAASTNRPQP